MRAVDLRAALPGYTCPSVAPVIEYLYAQERHDLIDALNAWQVQCSQLRAVAKLAIRQVKRLECQIDTDAHDAIA